VLFVEFFATIEIMKPHVYIFRGAPASGKGTIAPEIAKLLPKPVALIEQDKLRWGFHLIGRSVGDIDPKEHRFANENTLLLYGRYLEAGIYNIVLEGLFTWDDEQSSEGSAKELLNLANQHGFEATSIVLIADKEELLRRNDMRSYTVPADEFEALYNSVYQKQDASEIIIDSTSKSFAETVAKLKLLLAL
jgi:predicted kinase